MGDGRGIAISREEFRLATLLAAVWRLKHADEPLPRSVPESLIDAGLTSMVLTVDGCTFGRVATACDDGTARRLLRRENVTFDEAVTQLAAAGFVVQ